MNVAVIGFGKQGLSAVEYWTKLGDNITVCDRNSELQVPDNIQANLGNDYLTNLDQFDLIIRSPSIHPSDIAAANPDVAILSKVTTNTNEFFKVCPTKNIIGVTGTKGKGTTSTLIVHMLEAMGKRVHLGGNIGTPPLEMLKNNIKPDDWVVLELANFQLIDLRYSPHIATCLMIVPEHMDWHASYDEYLLSKKQLFMHQAENDIAIFYAQSEDSKDVVNVSKAKKIPYFDRPGAVVENNRVVIDDQIICEVNDIKLLGEHNWQNICAAVTTVWQVEPNVQAIKSIVTSFSGMKYRLEFIRELNGVKYYNDSYGTTPETAIVAIEAFKQPKILIVGGSDKGATYDELAENIAENNVKTVLAIGTTGPAIAEAIRRQTDQVEIIETGIDDMQSIVRVAKEHASDGDVILLSTACASFDMFDNYQARGDQFNQAVRALE